MAVPYEGAIKLPIPKQLQDQSGQIDFGKLKANPTDYSDYIRSRLEKNDFHSGFISDRPWHPYSQSEWDKQGEEAGGSKPLFEELAKAAAQGLQKRTIEELRSPGYQEEVYQPYRQQVLRDLATSSKSKQLSLNRRGMGSGGVAKGAQANLVKDTATDLAAGRQDIATAAESKAKEAEANAINFGIQQRNLQQQMYKSVYGSALESYMQRKQARQALGRGIGTVAGALAGSAIPGAGTAAGIAAGGAAGGYIGGELA